MCVFFFCIHKKNRKRYNSLFAYNIVYKQNIYKMRGGKKMVFHSVKLNEIGFMEW